MFSLLISTVYNINNIHSVIFVTALRKKIPPHAVSLLWNAHVFFKGCKLAQI